MYGVLNEREIVAKYKKDPNKHIIRIMSELNACTEKDIIKVLEKNGVYKTKNTKSQKARVSKKKEIK